MTKNNSRFIPWKPSKDDYWHRPPVLPRPIPRKPEEDSWWPEPSSESDFEIKKGVNPGRYKNKLTYVGIVLDRSGSMGVVKEEAVSGFNDQVATLRSEEDENHKIKVSLTTFSTEVDKIKGPLDCKRVPKLTSKNYVPSGWTSLYDAIGDTIRKINSAPVPARTDVSYLIIVISDGAENNSKKYSPPKIRSLVTRCQDNGWTFVYLGSNQDLSKIPETLGIHKYNIQSFDPTPIGYGGMSRETASAMSSYMSKVKANLSTEQFFDDKKK